MKQAFFMATLVAFSFTALAQGNSGRAKAKGKFKPAATAAANGSRKTKVYQAGQATNQNQQSSQQGQGSAKNQPKKVQAALLRDYPNASNVVWSKYKGDYTATFNNGAWRSTAVYHANGERRDTRTPLTRDQLPGSIWDRIFRRDNVTPTEYVQIERPSTLQKIYRVVSGNNATYYYDQNGNKVSYNY